MRLEASAGERPVSAQAPPLEGSPQQIADALRGLAEAGADEAILVANPITEESVRILGSVIR